MSNFTFFINCGVLLVSAGLISLYSVINFIENRHFPYRSIKNSKFNTISIEISNNAKFYMMNSPKVAPKPYIEILISKISKH